MKEDAVFWDEVIEISVSPCLCVVLCASAFILCVFALNENSRPSGARASRSRGSTQFGVGSRGCRSHLWRPITGPDRFPYLPCGVQGCARGGCSPSCYRGRLSAGGLPSLAAGTRLLVPVIAPAMATAPGGAGHREGGGRYRTRTYDLRDVNATL